ncbi:hypothetical protein O181_075477 [Austropuccinia psidii MF-1]|uniref:RNase H type-1 domain-containing protein n=1 Tax=Austropuccinia psidii MF-1 TaxID=1389203 RepID=A0A9Q3FCR1_9BASI|nr:hypothetical protein [Austropuccinia psidii MF-1]
MDGSDIKNKVGIIPAIEAARREIEIQSINGKKTNSIYIFSDNQGALLKLAYPFKPSTEQYLYLKVFHRINSLQKLAPIQLWWFPSKIGITGNELEYKEANNASLDSTHADFKLEPTLDKRSQETKKEKNNNKIT